MNKPKLKSSKKTQLYTRLLKERQNNFTIDWKAYQKKPIYNALSDKHASYYFQSDPVKKHLKKLKKTIINQTFINNKTKNQDLNDLTKYVSNKNREQNNIQKLNKAYTSFFKIRPYQQSLKPASLEKLSKTKDVWINRKERNQQSSTLNHLEKIKDNEKYNYQIPTILPKTKSRSYVSTKDDTNSFLSQTKYFQSSKFKKQVILNKNKSFKNQQKQQLKELSKDQFEELLKNKRKQLEKQKQRLNKINKLRPRTIQQLNKSQKQSSFLTSEKVQQPIKRSQVSRVTSKSKKLSHTYIQEQLFDF